VTAPDPGVAVRRTAIDALVRIDDEGAYANLVLDPVLAASGLEERDRRFVTELVYGTTRMRRACEHLVARHRRGGVSPRVAAALRLGAYQLAFAGVAPHAAVSATVGASPKPARGLVNAVLRRVADDVDAGVDWGDEATRLSYPDWVVQALARRLGPEQATAALEAMNRPATTHVRSDGYVQDLASQAVVAAVGAGPGMRVLDCCAAPGGKATGLAATGADVVAADRTLGRTRLVDGGAERTGHPVAVVVADATASPYRDGSFDRVLVDAPCSGLGVPRRAVAHRRRRPGSPGPAAGPHPRGRRPPRGPGRHARVQRVHAHRGGERGRGPRRPPRRPVARRGGDPRARPRARRHVRRPLDPPLTKTQAGP